VRRRLALLAFVSALMISACGDDGSAATSSAPAATALPETIPTTEAVGFPVDVGGVAIQAPPERIVSASATHTEILYAIGAGDDIIATDLYSNHPPEAEAIEKIDAFNLNAEALAALDPDLVVLSFDPGDASATFATLEIPALVFDAPADLEDVYDQITELGAATGQVDEAAATVDEMRSAIEEIVAGVDLPEEPITYYHEVDDTLYSITSSTFLGSLYGLLGLENIADPADGDGLGYPQLTAEYILDADPDLIFLGDVAYGETAASVAERPGWDTLSAVQEGRVVELDSDLASRWGPRIVEFLASVAASLPALGAG
jgi:iron complex transport system substrate-binding protein